MRMAVEDRRAQLVEAALEVATEDGVAATTVRRVAERAGVALGVVHYAFADKDELVAALATSIVEQLAAASEAGLEPGEYPDLRAALGAVVDGLWSAIESSPQAQLLTYEITTASLRSPELREVGVRQYAVSQAAVERQLELAAVAAGARWIRPVPELAGDVLAFVDGVTLRWLVDRDSAAARARLARLADQLASSGRRSRRPRPPVATGASFRAAPPVRAAESGGATRKRDRRSGGGAE